MKMRRLTLPFIGTTLTLPEFGRRVRIAAVTVQVSAENIRLNVLDGAGDIAFSVNGTAGTPLVFAPTFDPAGVVAGIPADLVVEQTDTVTLVAAGALTTSAVISFEELEA